MKLWREDCEFPVKLYKRDKCWFLVSSERELQIPSHVVREKCEVLVKVRERIVNSQ